MRKDLTTSVIAVLVLTVLLGLAYPFATTGVAQVLFPNKADGSQVEVDGTLVGSRLIGQDFDGRRRFFQSRPSATAYNPAGTFFGNLGPNNAELRSQYAKAMRAYLRRERAFTPSLRGVDVPPDAVARSASGVDPHISVADARIQANRVAGVRGLPVADVLQTVDEHTDGRGLGVFGEPGVNVLELNLALDREARR